MRGLVRSSRLLGIILAVACCRASSGSIGWPTVAGLRDSLVVRRGQVATADWTITTPSGDSLYRVSCRSYGAAEDPLFSYSGDFECRLVSLYSEETHSTLLTESSHQSRDWQSRARFLAEELVGVCARYPDWGATRSFRLRGMQIQLGLSDFVIDTLPIEGTRDSTLGLSAFVFRILVVSDPSARSVISQPSSFARPVYPDPSNPERTIRRCDRIVRTHAQNAR